MERKSFRILGFQKAFNAQVISENWNTSISIMALVIFEDLLEMLEFYHVYVSWDV